jgi:hypothetical protein
VHSIEKAGVAVAPVLLGREISQARCQARLVVCLQDPFCPKVIRKARVSEVDGLIATHAILR